MDNPLSKWPFECKFFLNSYGSAAVCQHVVFKPSGCTQLIAGLMYGQT